MTMNQRVDRQKNWFPFQLLTMAAVGLGVLFLLWRLTFDTEKDVFAHPADRTSLRLEALQRHLEKTISAGSDFPTSMERLITSLPPHMRETLARDAWDRPLRLQRRDAHYELRSSGPDGAFDTSDDVVVKGAVQDRK